MAVGPWQVVAILVIIVLLFGAKKIPELAQGIGKRIKILKKEVGNDDKTDEENKEKIEKKDEKQ